MVTMAQSLLDPTGNVAAERAVIADAPRPGSWFGDDGADGRMLTQEQTDLLIRTELRAMLPADAPAATVRELSDILGKLHSVELPYAGRRGREVTKQRGGLDSDPLVRLLAYRAWAERDRRWFELRGVQRGERVVQLAGGGQGGAPARSEVALAWRNEPVIGIVRRDAPPGALVEVEEVAAEPRGGSKPSRRTMQVSGRLRVELRVEPVTARLAERSDDDDGTPDLPLPRTAYRFDQLQIERDPAHGHAMIVAAVGACRAQVRVGTSMLASGGSADVWRRCFAVLADELRQLGATLGNFHR
jgi:hypothetical protein